MWGCDQHLFAIGTRSATSLEHKDSRLFICGNPRELSTESLSEHGIMHHPTKSIFLFPSHHCPIPSITHGPCSHNSPTCEIARRSDLSISKRSHVKALSQNLLFSSISLSLSLFFSLSLSFSSILSWIIYSSKHHCNYLCDSKQQP